MLERSTIVDDPITGIREPGNTVNPAHTRRAGRGQGLVELALLVPVLMLLAIGALDFGMAFYTKVVLQNSAREGAYYVVYNIDHAVAPPFPAAKTAVQTEGQNSGISIAPGEIFIECVPDNACPTGSTVVVTVSHPMPLLVDVLFKGPLVLTDEARMFVP